MVPCKETKGDGVGDGCFVDRGEARGRVEGCGGNRQKRATWRNRVADGTFSNLEAGETQKF